MQIPGKLTVTPTAGDGRGGYGQRQDAPAPSAAPQVTEATPSSAPGLYDPASRVALSAETLLFLSRVAREREKYPPLTRAEWNNELSPELAAREHAAFGRFTELGDGRAYYRAFIDYFDALRPEDQHSLRYLGTREAAVAGLRSLEYEDEAGLEPTDFQTLVSVLLDADKADLARAVASESQPLVKGDMFGWETQSFSYETERDSTVRSSEIERFYRESF
ncbi:biotin biosynthesis protein BioC [Rhizobium sp. CC-YZS058]|uniref:biotin biosynthesis protein BioC n=1 Tax=Rhizobium sp. CC-YZS058 TaxID=3042153 RepID=UPI002B05608C|nr:biotin biosynthesis protein BioC [Rhizobium sp. CC-YZS058]MEA3534798.1 biotin biosynthesis protein BioC [Rhizobium sp. CC-YZS058]